MVIDIHTYSYQRNEEKNKKIFAERSVSFADVVTAIKLGNIIDIIRHENISQYGHQYILIVQIRDYPYKVPFVVDGTTIFFKTLYPSRRIKKLYLIIDTLWTTQSL
jgi:hypothetical protein